MQNSSSTSVTPVESSPDRGARRRRRPATHSQASMQFHSDGDRNGDRKRGATTMSQPLRNMDPEPVMWCGRSCEALVHRRFTAVAQALSMRDVDRGSRRFGRLVIPHVLRHGRKRDFRT
jgi:hypothetical protein